MTRYTWSPMASTPVTLMVAPSLGGSGKNCATPVLPSTTRSLQAKVSCERGKADTVAEASKVKALLDDAM